jgi:uncharacterized protein (TIGR04141 family)
MYALPPALVGENEVKYNSRISGTSGEMLCMDRKNVKPYGATSVIEVCDFISKDSRLIHIKDQSGSSSLSHLFNQGTVSARTLLGEPKSRDKFIDRMKNEEKSHSTTGFSSLIPDSKSSFLPSNFHVVYAVINSSAKPRLPFFSLVTFRQAAKELKILGFNYEFCWISRPVASSKNKP